MRHCDLETDSAEAGESGMIHGFFAYRDYVLKRLTDIGKRGLIEYISVRLYKNRIEKWKRNGSVKYE